MLSLLLIAVLGLSLAQLLRSQINDRALRTAEQSAEQISRLGIQPQVTPDELKTGLSPDHFRTLDKAVRADLDTGNLAGLRVWNAEGQVVYADEADLVGQQLTPAGGCGRRSAATPAARRKRPTRQRRRRRSREGPSRNSPVTCSRCTCR